MIRLTNQSNQQLINEIAQSNKLEQGIQWLEKSIEGNADNASLYNNLGNAYKKSNDYDQAINYYEKAIELKPDYSQAYANLAKVLEYKKNYAGALQNTIKAIHLDPTLVDNHLSAGLLLMKLGRLAEAKTQFNNVLQLSPDNILAHYYLANISLNDDNLADAEQHYQAVLIIDPEHIDSLVNLGVIRIKQQEPQQAIDLFTKALALDIDNEEARNNLAATFIHHDRYENALMHYDVLLKSNPNNIEYHFNAGVAQMALGHLNEAITHFESILANQPKHIDSLKNLAAIYLRQQQKQSAIALYKQINQLKPNDETANYMLASLDKENVVSQAPNEYVKNLFDNYAYQYDTHLCQKLNYQAPQQLANYLKILSSTSPDIASSPTTSEMTKTATSPDLFRGSTKNKLTMIDLGCGTGLSGEILAPMAAHLIGVDLSEKMLAIARSKNVYDELVCQDITDYLNRLKTKIDLFCALDLLPYLGDLTGLFNLIAQHLSEQGQFLFTTEISHDEDYLLQPTARFAHHPDYIKQLADNHHFKIICQQKFTARIQDDKPLAAYFYVLTKTPQDKTLGV